MNKFEKGDVSFSVDDIKKAMSESPNAEAYDYVNKAMTTSAHVTDKDSESVEIDDIYPITKEECDEMSNLLDKAEENIKDQKDTELKNKISELRTIAEWSQRRHWTIRWTLIVACLISAWFFNRQTNENQKGLDERTKQLNVVMNWSEQDTTISYESIIHEGFYYYEDRIKSANLYKLYHLASLKESITHTEELIRSERANADMSSDEASKQEHLARAEANEKSLKVYKEKYEEAQNLKFDDIKEIAEKELNRRVTVAENQTHGSRKYLIFLIILLPLYIVSCYQWGYEISRRRAESAVLSKIEKAIMGIAVFFFGAGLAMKLLPDFVVTERWSNGQTRTYTEANTGNAIVWAMKIGLIIVGVIIFCLGSVLLMTYLTITGLKRNYDWKKLANKAAEKAKQSKA